MIKITAIKIAASHLLIISFSHYIELCNVPVLYLNFKGAGEGKWYDFYLQNAPEMYVLRGLDSGQHCSEIQLFG